MIDSAVSPEQSSIIRATIDNQPITFYFCNNGNNGSNLTEMCLKSGTIQNSLVLNKNSIANIDIFDKTMNTFDIHAIWQHNDNKTRLNHLECLENEFLTMRHETIQKHTRRGYYFYWRLFKQPCVMQQEFPEMYAKIKHCIEYSEVIIPQLVIQYRHKNAIRRYVHQERNIAVYLPKIKSNEQYAPFIVYHLIRLHLVACGKREIPPFWVSTEDYLKRQKEKSQESENSQDIEIVDNGFEKYKHAGIQRAINRQQKQLAQFSKEISLARANTSNFKQLTMAKNEYMTKTNVKIIEMKDRYKNYKFSLKQGGMADSAFNVENDEILDTIHSICEREKKIGDSIQIKHEKEDDDDIVI